jgi:hypothetical protein
MNHQSKVPGTTLADLHINASLLDIDAEWSECTHMKTLRLYADNSHKSLTGNDKTGASRKVGVYRHTAVIDDEPVVIYVGMTMAGSSSIANRQTSHFCSFKNPHNTNEKSGWKYRDLIQKLGVEYLDVRIEYVDLTHLNVGLIPLFEILSINHLLPLINQRDKSEIIE